MDLSSLAARTNLAMYSRIAKLVSNDPNLSSEIKIQNFRKNTLKWWFNRIPHPEMRNYAISRVTEELSKVKVNSIKEAISKFDWTSSLNSEQWEKFSNGIKAILPLPFNPKSCFIDYPIKTVGWWFSRLKDPVVREKAFFNIKSEKLYHQVGDIQDAIQKFNFSNTPEGSLYWQALDNNWRNIPLLDIPFGEPIKNYNTRTYAEGTAGWWYGCIKDVNIRARAYNATPVLKLNDQCDNIKDAISSCICNALSAEGGQFWRNVERSLVHEDALLPRPIFTKKRFIEFPFHSTGWWLCHMINKDHVKQAIANIIAQKHLDRLFNIVSSVAEALNSSMTWGTTIEGSQYWRTIHGDYEYNRVEIDPSPDFKIPFSHTNNFKIKKIRIPVKEQFTKFSAELTYMPALFEDFNHVLLNEKDLMHSLFGRVNDHIKGVIAKTLKSPWTICIDSTSLEIQSGKQTDIKKFMIEKLVLEEKLQRYSYLPSTLVSIDDEGGCHMNFDLEWMQEARGHLFVEEFISNYRNFICSNPSIVWMFLSPNDDNSSNIIYRNIKSSPSDYSKGEFMTLRESNKSGPNNWKNVGYVELRHFMMPRSDKEFMVHYTFAQTLLRYIYRLTIRNEKVKFQPIEVEKFRKEVLGLYTYEKAVEEMKAVCSTIKYSFNKITSVGKLQLLNMRFTYQEKFRRTEKLGSKNWLV